MGSRLSLITHLHARSLQLHVFCLGNTPILKPGVSISFPSLIVVISIFESSTGGMATAAPLDTVVHVRLNYPLLCRTPWVSKTLTSFFSSEPTLSATKVSVYPIRTCALLINNHNNGVNEGFNQFCTQTIASRNFRERCARHSTVPMLAHSDILLCMGNAYHHP